MARTAKPIATVARSFALNDGCTMSASGAEVGPVAESVLAAMLVAMMLRSTLSFTASLLRMLTAHIRTSVYVKRFSCKSGLGLTDQRQSAPCCARQSGRDCLSGQALLSNFTISFDL
jgi:hypothetical protein